MKIFLISLDSPGFARRRRVSPLDESYLHFVASRVFEIIRTVILASKWLLKWNKKLIFNFLVIRKEIIFWWRNLAMPGETRRNQLNFQRFWKFKAQNENFAHTSGSKYFLQTSTNTITSQKTNKIQFKLTSQMGLLLLVLDRLQNGKMIFIPKFC